MGQKKKLSRLGELKIDPGLQANLTLQAPQSVILGNSVQTEFERDSSEKLLIGRNII